MNNQPVGGDHGKVRRRKNADGKGSEATQSPEARAVSGGQGPEAAEGQSAEGQSLREVGSHHGQDPIAEKARGEAGAGKEAQTRSAQEGSEGSAVELSEAANGSNLKGMFVSCPNCSGVYHALTDQYRPGAMVSGEMFSLIRPYRDWGWSSFTPDAGPGDILCPECGGDYAPDGFTLRLVKPTPEVARMLT